MMFGKKDNIKEIIVSARQDERERTEREWRDKMERREKFLKSEFILEVQQLEAKIELLERRMQSMADEDRSRQSAYEKILEIAAENKRHALDNFLEVERMKDVVIKAYQGFAMLKDRAEVTEKKLLECGYGSKLILGLED